MNWEGIFQLLNFAILAFMVVHFGKKPIQDGLEAHSNEIARLINDAETRLQGAKVALEASGKALKGAETEVSEILKRAESMQENFRREIQEAAHKEAERLQASAKENIALETQMAIAALRREVIAQAALKATQDLGSLDENTQKRLVSEFARKVGEGSFAK